MAAYFSFELEQKKFKKIGSGWSYNKLKYRTQFERTAGTP
jgi:hypothetical protein